MCYRLAGIMSSHEQAKHTHTQPAAGGIHTPSNTPNHTKAHAALLFPHIRVRTPTPKRIDNNRANIRTARKNQNHDTQHVVIRIWHLIDFTARFVYNI